MCWRTFAKSNVFVVILWQINDIYKTKNNVISHVLIGLELQLDKRIDREN